MKRLFILVVFGLILPLRAWSQDILYFNLTFIGNAPPHHPYLPVGGGALENNVFSPIVYLDNLNAPTSGRILELADDNSFQTISDLNVIFAAYYLPGVG